MKYNKQIILFLFVLVSFISYPIFSQTTIDVNELSGTWKLNYGRSINEMNADSKARFHKINSKPSRLEKFKSLYHNRTIEFNANGNSQQVLSKGRVIEALWSVDENNILTLTNAKGRKMYFKILSLTNNQLVLELDNGSKKSPFLKTRYFNRINR